MIFSRSKQAFPLIGTMLILVTLFSLALETTAFAKSSTAQSPSSVQNMSLVQQKLALSSTFNTGGKKTSNVIPLCTIGADGLCETSSYPSSYSVYQYPNVVSEPPVSGTDVKGKQYTDGYMAYLCGPGATTVALRYWVNTDTRSGTGSNGLQTYTNPANHISLSWDNTYERSYLMYIATQSYPPAYSSPGEETYNSTPANSYTTFQDLADALNWEASKHSSSYRSFFYITEGYSSNFTIAKLRSYIISDLTGPHHVPAVVSVRDSYLPSWSNSPYKGYSHFVSILGYNNNNNTFTYAETCGSQACGTSGVGYYTINQQTLFNAIQDDVIDGSNDGGIIW